MQPSEKETAVLQRSDTVRSHHQPHPLIDQRRPGAGQRQSADGAQSVRPQRQLRSCRSQPLRSAKSSPPRRLPHTPTTSAPQRVRQKSSCPAPELTRPVLPLQPHQQQRPSQRPPRSDRQGKTRRQGKVRRQRLWHGLWLYGLRALVTGMGGCAIAGTTVAILNSGLTKDSATRLSRNSAPLVQRQGSSMSRRSTLPQNYWAQHQQTDVQIQPAQELTAVKAQIKKLAAAQAGLTPALFFYRPDTGAYLNIAGNQAVPAASTIKLPVLIAFFQAVDAGKVRLDQQLVMRKDLVASEAGVMQYEPVGTQFSALETAELMITISDNTATNMLIDLLGGAKKLNFRFKAWGLTHTEIQNLLPDLGGHKHRQS